MTPIVLLFLALIGLIVGFFTGIFGIGGGLLLIPALVFFLDINQQTAQGTSIAMMLLPVGLFAFMNYYRAGHVNINYAIVLAITFMFGSFFGSKISLSLSEIVMKKIFGIVVALIALKIIFSK